MNAINAFPLARNLLRCHRFAYRRFCPTSKRGENMTSTPLTMQATAPRGMARWLRLVPIAMLIYVISFMDRTNISYAFAGLARDFGIDKAQQGLAAGIFFIGYIALQIPGGHLAERWSAKKFIGIMILVWGVFAVLCGLARSYEELLVYRFLLGVAEGGIWPAMLVLLSHWFPVKERARAYGFWMMNLAIASIITQPLSGFIVSTTSWRWLFIIEGVLPFLVAAPLWWLFVHDSPTDAPWVSAQEKEWIARELRSDRRSEPPPVPFSSVFTTGRIWILVSVYFLIQVGFYGLNLWLPTVLHQLTREGFATVGLLAAVPYLFAIVGLGLNGWAADRTRRYSLHVLAAMVVASFSLVLSIEASGVSTALSVALVSVAMGGALSYDGPFWAAASRTLPTAVVGGAMGLINALGNLGGYFGPSIAGWLQDRTGGFTTTAFFLAGALLLAGLLMLAVGQGRSGPQRPSA